jgi:hypothetical protein
MMIIIFMMMMMNRRELITETDGQGTSGKAMGFFEHLPANCGLNRPQFVL